MTLRTGLAAQWGMVDEVTYGVPVAVTRFLPLVDDGLKQDIDRIEAKGTFPGRQVLDSTQWAPGRIKVGGDVGFELYDRGIGLLLKHMFGTIATTGSGPYTHTATPGDLFGVSFTQQVGRPDVGGTVRPFTYPGSKIASWEIGWKEGENATLGLTTMARAEYRSRSVTDGVTTSGSAAITSATGAFSQSDVGSPITGTGIPASTTILSVQSATAATLSANATATGSSITFTIGVALASASMPSGIIPFRYLGVTLTIGGTAFKVNEGKLAGDNKLTERRFGGQSMTDEPLPSDRREYTGELKAEFNDLTQYNRFVNGGEAALVAAFAAGSNTLTFTTNVRFDGATPNVKGRDIVAESLPFKCIGTTDAAAITAVAVNSDATP